MGTSAGQIEKLTRILDVTRQMAATTDLDALLGMIVDAACRVLDCERATIFLYDAGNNELYSRVATGVESIRFPADRGIAGAAASAREIVNVPHAYSDPRFNREIDKKTGFRTRNLLTFPLENLAGELMGVLQTLNKISGPFDARDEDLARALSAQAGVALHRGRLLEEHAEKQRMARDLEIARRIQQTLFPKENPVVAGYEIAGWNRSADETGGDCYDFIPLEDGRLAVLLADATGHGIGAALIIAQCRSLVRAMLTVTTDLAAIVNQVNRLLEHDLSAEKFVTAFFGVLDPARHRVDYVAAGQGPLLLLGADGPEMRTANGLPLAIMGDADYETATYELAPGSSLALLTDGFYEAANVAGDLFGEQRVIELLERHISESACTLIERLHAGVSDFAAGCPQADDLTAVLIRRGR